MFVTLLHQDIRVELDNIILTDRDKRNHLVSLGVSKILHTSRLGLLAAIEALSITRFPSRPVPTATPHTIKTIEFLPATQPVLHPSLRPMYKRDRYRIHLLSHHALHSVTSTVVFFGFVQNIFLPVPKRMHLNPSDLNANWLCMIRTRFFYFQPLLFSLIAVPFFSCWGRPWVTVFLRRRGSGGSYSRRILDNVQTKVTLDVVHTAFYTLAHLV